MDGLQFSLFFAALLVGYVLVHLRMVRFEEHLQKLAGIRGLDDRLRTLDDRLEKLVEALGPSQLTRVEGHLQRIQEGIEDLREATGDVSRAVVQIPAAPIRSTDGGEHGDAQQHLPRHETPAARIVALAEGRLLQLGYRNLRLLGDLSDVQLTDEVEIQVECERAGMPMKGRVVVRNGGVKDVALQPASQMFP